MQINLSIKIEKRHVIFLSVLVCMVFVIGVFAASSPVGHDPEEIGSGTFGGNDYTFPGNVNIQNTLTAGIITLGGVSRTTWPPVVINMTAPNIIAGMFGANVGGGDYGFPRDVNVTRNIILGGVARGTWPKEMYNVSAENVSAGVFGARMGGGSYRFPQNLNVTNNLSVGNRLYSGNITNTNNLTSGNVTANDNVYAGKIVMVGGYVSPAINAYLSGWNDGNSKPAVEIGSLNSDVKYVDFWNGGGTGAWMNIRASNLTSWNYISLGGVPRNTWPKEVVPGTCRTYCYIDSYSLGHYETPGCVGVIGSTGAASGTCKVCREVMRGIDANGNVICAREDGLCYAISSCGTMQKTI